MGFSHHAHNLVTPGHPFGSLPNIRGMILPGEPPPSADKTGNRRGQRAWLATQRQGLRSRRVRGKDLCRSSSATIWIGSPLKMRSITVAPPRIAGTITWR
jgi:hypothetical protein